MEVFVGGGKSRVGEVSITKDPPGDFENDFKAKSFENLGLME